MNSGSKNCVLSVKIEERSDGVRAFCPELNLVDHGSSVEEAEAQLMKSIWLFMRVCADKGTLYKVLGERGALREGGESGGIIQIPIPLHLFVSPENEAK